jgi:hypothetical protein
LAIIIDTSNNINLKDLHNTQNIDDEYIVLPTKNGKQQQQQ